MQKEQKDWYLKVKTALSCRNVGQGCFVGDKEILYVFRCLMPICSKEQHIYSIELTNRPGHDTLIVADSTNV